MNFGEVAVIDVGVDLCGSDGGVAEERLYCSDVGSFFDEGSGKAMSERVRCDFFVDAGKLGVSFDDVFDGISTEMFTQLVYWGTDKKIWWIISSFGEVVFEFLSGDRCSKNGSDFGAFSDDGELFAVEFDVCFFQSNQFWNSESGAVQEVEDCFVSGQFKWFWSEFGRSGEDVFDLLIVEIIDLSRRGFGEFEFVRRDAIYIVFEEKFEEGSDSDDMIIDSFDIESVLI